MERTDAWIDFIVCFLFGYLGVHKFREKQFGMGILYLFTVGLFGVGWIIDSIRYLMVALKKDCICSDKPTQATVNGTFIVIQPDVLDSSSHSQNKPQFVDAYADQWGQAIDIANPTTYEPWGQNGPDISGTPYANTMFLNWADGKPVYSDNDGYPRYMNYHYGIYSPIEKHLSMIKTGYLEQMPPIETLKLLKVNELKGLLSVWELPVSGTKGTLIERIKEHGLDSGTISSMKVFYQLSDKGWDYINHYKYYIEVQPYLENCIFKLYEFECIKNQSPQLSTFDIVWSIYSRKLQEEINNSVVSYDSVRNIELAMYELLSDQGLQIDAIFHLIMIMYIDLSGLSQGSLIKQYDELSIPSGLIDRLHGCKEYYNDSLIARCYQRQLPFHYFNPDVFAGIMHDILVNGFVDLQNYKVYANTPPSNLCYHGMSGNELHIRFHN